MRVGTDKFADKIFQCRKKHRVVHGSRTDSAILSAIEDALGGRDPDPQSMNELWMDATAIGCEIREAIKCNTP